jgi:hypothetical protein
VKKVPGNAKPGLRESSSDARCCCKAVGGAAAKASLDITKRG